MMAPTTWRAVGVSTRGTSHVKTGDPCQDAHGWRVMPSGALVVAVADGAGTARLADIGATVAVASALENVCAGLETSTETEWTDEAWHAVLLDCVAAALRAIELEAAVRNVVVRDLACTLLVAVAIPGELVAAVQIGDGAVVAGGEGGEVFAVTRPAVSEYLNETTFLISPGAIDGASVAVWRGVVTRLAALTDGLQMLALRLPGGDPHPGFFDPMFRFVAGAGDPDAATASLQGFLDTPRVRERADDDLTLFLAACGPS